MVGRSTKGASTKQQRPPLWKIWVTAARPHTLTASLCPCLVSMAYIVASTNLYQRQLKSNESDQSSSPVPTVPWTTLWLIWLWFCVSVQIGTNLHNDYADFVQGADNAKSRVGQARATAMGWLTPFQTCAAATITLTTTLVAGLVILSLTQQWSNAFLWFWILSSVFNAFAYTGGPYPLGYLGLLPKNWSIAYAGLGDIFVFLYFGLVATWMVSYLMYCQEQQQMPRKDDASLFSTSSPTSASPLSLLLYGLQVGLLATNIIVVNNLRDRHTDVLAGKYTTAVRFGKNLSTWQYRICNAAAYALVLVDCWDTRQSGDNVLTLRPTRLVPLLSIPLALRETRAILTKEGAALNAHVGGTAKVQLAFCLLLTATLVWYG